MKRGAVPSILVAVVLLALGVIAEAQQQAKVPKIGLLEPVPPLHPPGLSYSGKKSVSSAILRTRT
jgi:hypothetical protein